jgi:hypothetical protein
LDDSEQRLLHLQPSGQDVKEERGAIEIGKKHRRLDFEKNEPAIAALETLRSVLQSQVNESRPT